MVRNVNVCAYTNVGPFVIYLKILLLLINNYNNRSMEEIPFSYMSYVFFFSDIICFSVFHIHVHMAIKEILSKCNYQIPCIQVVDFYSLINYLVYNMQVVDNLVLNTMYKMYITINQQY